MIWISLFLMFLCYSAYANNLNQTAPSQIINCVYESKNMCSNPLYACNAKAGYRAWCDSQWDHHCCCTQGPPVGKVCSEPEKCHYVCCDWPQKPCGYKCCDPPK